MKRYLVFAGYCFYPEGGAHDYRGSYSGLPEAEQAILDEFTSHSAEWGHVFDPETGTIVYSKKVE